MIESFESGATASLVEKIELKNYLSLLKIDCLNKNFEVLDMIESFVNSATASLAAKNGTKKLSQPFQDRF